MDSRIINILGEFWRINYDVEKLEDPNSDAETNPHERTINVRKLEDWADKNRIVRHEIIHAFLFESGLGFNYEHKPFGHDETMVDWLAIQWPKIKHVFRIMDIEN